MPQVTIKGAIPVLFGHFVKLRQRNHAVNMFTIAILFLILSTINCDRETVDNVIGAQNHDKRPVWLKWFELGWNEGSQADRERKVKFIPES